MEPRRETENSNFFKQKRGSTGGRFEDFFCIFYLSQPIGCGVYDELTSGRPCEDFPVPTFFLEKGTIYDSFEFRIIMFRFSALRITCNNLQ
jgi:hypothetical protein